MATGLPDGTKPGTKLMITWTNVDFSLMRFCGIRLRAISQQIPKLLFCIISLKIKITATFPKDQWVHQLDEGIGEVHTQGLLLLTEMN